MNCIFTCIFNQTKNIDVFFLFLKSLLTYGNLDKNTNILVYTSTTFMNMIKQSHLFNDKIVFEINDNYNSLEKSCNARLDLFNLQSINNYTKILYLDTDILIKDDINKIFNVCQNDLLYVLQEDFFTVNDYFYGANILFGDEINKYADLYGFTTEILLFNNCEKIKDLFCKIKEDMLHRSHPFICHDQPYIVYNAFKHNLYDSQTLKYNISIKKTYTLSNFKITNWNEYNREELHTFDHNVLTAYNIPNNLIRIGPREDGGYVIAYGFEYDLLISCGIANDVRFEEEFLDIHNIKCFAFDGTIQSFPFHRNKIEWISKNIGHLNTEKTTNLKEYIKNYKNIFLKMDIEGSEFNWLDSMSEAELDKFSQIVIEFHWPFDIYRMNILKKLNVTHYIIHVHGNNGLGLYNIRNINCDFTEINIPEVFEVTYINKKLFNTPLEKIHKQYPIDGLDYGNHPNHSIKDLDFFIPSCENSVYIGSSCENTKIVKLKNNPLLGHNLLNKKNDNWCDRFDIKVINNNLVVKRIDLNCGWDQPITIPIKYNKILVYSGVPFHYDVIGFILEFSKKYKIEVDLVLKYPDYLWIDFFKAQYIFNVFESLPCNINHYLFVMLLTDNDESFPDNLINGNIVCIDHYYKNRRPLIKHHIPIAPFGENINSYALPVFEYINYHDKVKLLTQKRRPVISFVGTTTSIEDIDSLSIIDNISDFDIYIIDKYIPNKHSLNLPNTFFFEGIPAKKMFELLSESTYMCYIPNLTLLNAHLQKNCQIVTSSIFTSFTTGCKLILPKEMNKFLKLNSIIEYSSTDKLILDKTPSLIETFNEREKLINIRDESIFDLKHMKMFLEWRKNKKLENKTYTWEYSTITFLPNFEMDAFGKGDYEFVDDYRIVARFGYRTHNVVFNNDYTEFTSTRADDFQIVNGTLINK